MLDPLKNSEDGNIDWLEFAGLFFSNAHPMFSNFDVSIKGLSEQGVEIEALLGPYLSADHGVQFLHSGTLTLLLDTAFGIALFAHIKDLTPIATINLKTDYLSPAKPETKLICRASCFALDGNIARMQGEISNAASQTVLAKASAAFMIGSKGPSFAEFRNS